MDSSIDGEPLAVEILPRWVTWRFAVGTGPQMPLLKKPISKEGLWKVLSQRKLEFDTSGIEDGSLILGYRIDLSNPDPDEQRLSVVYTREGEEGPFVIDVYIGPRFANSVRRAAREGRGPDWFGTLK